MTQSTPPATASTGPDARPARPTTTDTKVRGRLVRQLTGLDAQFLAFEDARNVMHVSALAILDPADAPGGTVSLADIHELVRERLHVLPPFRWRLATVPLGIDHPYWVEDPDFDLEFHVRELALPAPGDDVQVAAQVERIVARPLDRSRPLWELYVIQGLEGGRVALLTKIHHALVDGVSGAEILGTLFDVDPAGGELPPRPAEVAGGGVPGPLELAARGVVGAPRRALGGLRRLPITLASLDEVPTMRAVPGAGLIGAAAYRAHRAATRNADGRVLERPRHRAPRTSMNASISPHRRVSFGSLSLETVKEIKNAHGTTVNDVVVALCAGAVRQWLLAHDDLPAEPLLAMVPMSVRRPEEMGTYGNRVATLIVPIPTDEPDPIERLRRAHSDLVAAKQRHRAIPAELLSDVTNFVPPALFARASRMTAAIGSSPRFRPHVNLVISNVPGSRVPLHIAGARLEAQYPVSIITDGMGVNITVLSYQDRLDFGIVGDRELAPDLDLIIDALGSDLIELARRGPRTASDIDARHTRA
jgi:WS/DGAT/MGAT family acyltransferase